MTWALLIALAGFLLITVVGIVFKTQVIRHFEGKSSELGKYYYWIFPFSLGLTLYSLLEAYAWQLRKSVLANYLREVQFRLTTLALILLYLFGIIGGFGTLIKLYAFNYLLVALILMIWLIRNGHLHFVFSPSVVSRKFYPKICSLALLAWSGGLVFNIAFFFAQIVIAATVAGGLTAVGIFTLAQYIGSLIQAPQRSIMAAAIGPLSRAWKDKDYGRINRIYQRSSINQLIFSVGVFVLIWINFTDAIETFHFKPDYLAARPVFFFIGMARIVDMGTGVNNQIIATSTYWRFDFISGLILVSLTLPLNYLLAKDLGVIGPAIADLITFSIYNAIRWVFLFRKFRMQPFTSQTVYTILLGAAAYLVCYLLFASHQGLLWLFVRSLTFLGIYGAGVIGLGLSEDILPVLRTIKGRLQGLRGGSTRP